MSNSAAASPPPGAKPPGSTGRDPHEDGRSAWAAGGAVFAGLMLMINGVLAVLEGIVGIAKDVVYVRTRGDYVYKFDVTAWGWIHLVLGVVALLVGYFLLRGLAFARYIGIFIAGLSLIANFMFLPYQPIWAIIMIAIDTFVIWALATYHPRNLPYGSAL
ncbi:hypothetical protein RVR_4074 [Actinacidiphila reveromycinica]|uniref:DUF7144 domain-containing protein n=1 Tax=Actinacidiphila reveromycinica TaxID=659352 RepID=A0A7U3USY2_9ACTN|nr:hypothetical protein [Streptomyces sp. SN-593]BBA98041.1 hypothetical protein RVR_4074 [Streptomyces sp. SN-593]